MKKNLLKKNIITSTALIVLMLSLFNCSDKKNASKTENEIIIPKKGNIEIKVLSTGSISPFKRIEIKATANGRVDKIFFDEGDYI